MSDANDKSHKLVQKVKKTSEKNSQVSEKSRKLGKNVTS